jgi:hypothetical protein
MRGFRMVQRQPNRLASVPRREELCRFGSLLKLGGLGSSHTTPCGAVVPARPPTRSSHTTGRVCAAQWARGATEHGTRVLVLELYSFFRTGAIYVADNARVTSHQLPLTPLRNPPK